MRKDYYEENTGVFLFGIYDTVKRTDSDPARTHLHAEPEIALVTCGSAEYLLGKDRFEVRKTTSFSFRRTSRTPCFRLAMRD